MTTDSRQPGSVLRRQMLVAAATVAGSLVLPPAIAMAAAGATGPRKKLDIDRFIADCIEAGRERESQSAVLEVLARSVSEPAAMLEAVGGPTRAGITVLHRSATLTIFNAAWTPRMNLMPHNHLMWANIGIYAGREDNILWRQEPDGIHAFGARALFAGDVVALPGDVIHSVTNPLLRYTGGIHVYGGDFFATTRSQWDPETLTEARSDGAAIRRMFELENERHGS